MPADSALLVSVVIPAYNAGKTLAETLRSVSNQTYRNLEILVVDDGSSDGTFELASEYSLCDARVRVLHQANGGVARARNYALRDANGSLVAPIDADDLWHPRKIELQLQALQRFSEGRAVAYNWFAAIDGNGVVSGHSRPVTEEGDVFSLLVRENFIANGSTPLMPRAEVLACGGYDPALRDRGAEGCEDLKLYLTLAERLPFAVAPAFLTGYRSTSGNMSSNAHRMLASHALVMAEVRQRHPHLAAAITAAEFDTARWYLKKAFLAGDRGQIRKVALLIAARFPMAFAAFGADWLWRFPGRSLRGGGTSSGLPKDGTSASVEIPESGTPFADRFAAMPAGIIEPRTAS